MTAGSPFALAHTFSQTGPFRPANLVRGIDNAVLAGGVDGARGGGADRTAVGQAGRRAHHRAGRRTVSGKRTITSSGSR